MTLVLPLDFLRQVAIRGTGARRAKQNVIISAVSGELVSTLVAVGIDNDYRAAYWAGQVCEESDQFSTTEEYASGEAYEGRADLGNVHAGDGERFKGRGLIQLTGRVNYARYSSRVQLDLVENPELAAVPLNALRIACCFWQEHGLSVLADADDLEAITRRINGGLNGLVERQAATDRAFNALGYDVVG